MSTHVKCYLGSRKSINLNDNESRTKGWRKSSFQGFEDDYRLSPFHVDNELTFRNCHFAIDNIQFMLSSIIQQLIYVSNWQSLFKMFFEWKISIWPPRSFSLASRRLLNIIMQEKEFFCIKRNYWNLFKFKKELEEIGIIINRETVGLALLHLRDDSP